MELFELLIIYILGLTIGVICIRLFDKKEYEE